MEQTERRLFGRVSYLSEGIAVICDTQKVMRVGIVDIGPGGVGITMPPDAPKMIGEDMILITDTMIMYMDVIRQELLGDGTWRAGLAARKFSPEVLQYLADSIELKSKYEESSNGKEN